MNLHHPGITVPDMEAAILWYQKVLDLAPHADVTVPENNLRIVLLKHPANGWCIELFQIPGQERTEPAWSDVGQSLAIEGWRHVAWVVDDLDATMGDLVSKGAEKVLDPVRNEGFGYTYAFIRDPFGNLLEFVELI
jgi:catechol 2,3-dioxygenase-like lactoylglutathione lyase family enzyme